MADGHSPQFYYGLLMGLLFGILGNALVTSLFKMFEFSGKMGLSDMAVIFLGSLLILYGIVQKILDLAEEKKGTEVSKWGPRITGISFGVGLSMIFLLLFYHVVFT